MRSLLLLVLVSSFLLACGGAKDGGDTTVDSAPDAAAKGPDAAKTLPGGSADQEALLAAETAARKLGFLLKSTLGQTISKGGTIAAVDLCNLQAKPLTDRVGLQAGGKAGRSSLKLRNPANDGPAWVTAWLQSQDGKGATEAKPSRSIETVDGKQVARFIGPIGIDPLCLGCHGSGDEIDAGTKAAIASKYPSDKATGYKTGELRGAVWTEVPVVAAAAPAAP